jgi:hypothetical protein
MKQQQFFYMLTFALPSSSPGFSGEPCFVDGNMRETLPLSYKPLFN